MSHAAAAGSGRLRSCRPISAKRLAEIEAGRTKVVSADEVARTLEQ
jgi:hypothetical protein